MPIDIGYDWRNKLQSGLWQGGRGSRGDDGRRPNWGPPPDTGDWQTEDIPPGLNGDGGDRYWGKPSDRGQGRAPIDRGDGTWDDRGWGGFNFQDVDWGGIVDHFTNMDWQNMDWQNMDWRSWLGGMPWSSWLGEGNWENIQDRRDNWRNRGQDHPGFLGPPEGSQPEMSEPERIPQHLQGDRAGWNYPDWLSKITSSWGR